MIGHRPPPVQEFQGRTADLGQSGRGRAGLFAEQGVQNVDQSGGVHLHARLDRGFGRGRGRAGRGSAGNGRGRGAGVGGAGVFYGTCFYH